MVVWRLDKKKHASQALSGIGAEKMGGRWNPPGLRLVYTSVSQSLATCEVLVHATAEIAKQKHVCARIELDEPLIEDFRHVASVLGPNWRDNPIGTRNFGERWLIEQRSVALRVPSAVVGLDDDGEDNLLLNPAHVDFSAVKLLEVRPHAFDARLIAQYAAAGIP